jgi:hypothetical protein
VHDLSLSLAFLFEVRTETTADLQNVLEAATTESSTFPSTKTAITLLVTHASLCIFWALLAGQPRDDWLDLPFVTIMGINQYCINPVITITIIFAFVLQAQTASQIQGPSTLDLITLVLQIFIFLALAVSWPLRFRVPQNLYLRADVWWLEAWYPLVGWACVNSAIVAVGQSIVLYAVCVAENRTVLVGERQALLP